MIYVRFRTAGSERAGKMRVREFYLEALEKLEQENQIRILTVLEGRGKGEKRFLKDEEGEVPGCCVEFLYGTPRVVLCGGGHVSFALYKIFRMLNFQVTVLEEREDFARKERFPDAEIFCEPFEVSLKNRNFGRNAYYVIVTRGHTHDYICLSQILQKPYAYVGMIGSKKKVALSVERLKKEGFSQEKIRSVHAPIGLPIKARTPEEIAVSIAGEIILEKNRTEQSILERSVAEAIRDPKDGVLVSVLKKQGSSPRGAGSRMVVYEDGTICGTIGGGNVEFAAISRAKTMTEDFALEVYDLGNSQAADLGMVCGGRIEVMFERL